MHAALDERKLRGFGCGVLNGTMVRGVFPTAAAAQQMVVHCRNHTNPNSVVLDGRWIS